MLRKVLLVLLTFTATSFADTVIMSDGAQFDGTVTGITEQHVLLKAGRDNLSLSRSAVKALIFTTSDLIIRAAGDTIRGKVLRNEGDGYVIAHERGKEVVPLRSIREIAYVSGPSVEIHEVAATDEAFRIEQRQVQTRRGSLFLSAYGGPQGAAYVRVADPYGRWTDYEKAVQGIQFGFEAGMELGRGFTLSGGASWFSARTEIAQESGYLHPDEVGYISTYISGLYSIFPESDFDLFLRLRLAVQKGTTAMQGGSTHSKDFLKGTIVPGAGVKYRVIAPLDLFCEIGISTADLDLDIMGSSLKTDGVFLNAGIRFYFVTSS
jgi:hypothetical protein